MFHLEIKIKVCFQNTLLFLEFGKCREYFKLVTYSQGKCSVVFYEAEPAPEGAKVQVP
jgi:hypothetical protein